jgi:hypothetical protein
MQIIYKLGKQKSKLKISYQKKNIIKSRSRVLSQNFEMIITQSIWLIISIIAYFWKWHGHYTHFLKSNRNLDILSKYIIIAIFSSVRKSFEKILDFKSAISPLSRHEIRRIFFQTMYFFSRNLNM